MFITFFGLSLILYSFFNTIKHFHILYSILFTIGFICCIIGIIKSNFDIKVVKEN